jgi:hypothetical protein
MRGEFGFEAVLQQEEVEITASARESAAGR